MAKMYKHKKRSIHVCFNIIYLVLCFYVYLRPWLKCTDTKKEAYMFVI